MDFSAKLGNKLIPLSKEEDAQMGQGGASRCLTNM